MDRGQGQYAHPYAMRPPEAYYAQGQEEHFFATRAPGNHYPAAAMGATYGHATPPAMHARTIYPADYYSDYAGWGDRLVYNNQYGMEMIEGWHETIRVAELQVEISEMTFDPLHETLWVGYHHGRLTSYTEPSLEKYSSFMVSSGPVNFVSCFAGGLITGGGEHLSLRSRGGVTRQKYSVPSLDGQVVDNRAAAFLESAGAQADDFLDYKQFVVGGTSHALHSFDITRPASTLKLPAGINVIKCGRMLACGGLDGKVYLTDARLRSTRVEFSFAAHSGRVNDLEILGDFVVSCGVSARSINPYDKNAPTQTYPDPMIQIIDLRMMRKGAGFTFPSSRGARMLSAMPQLDNRFVAASADGTYGFFDLSNNGVAPQYYQVGDGEGITSMSVSSTGDIIAFGSQTGVVYHCAERTVDVSVNISSTELDYPVYPPSQPLVQIPPSDPSPASQYLLLRTAAHESNLLSTFPKWAEKSVVCPVPQKRVKKDLLQAVQEQEFLGYIKNPGVKANSLLFGRDETVLEECDPRSNIAEDAEIDLRRRMSNLRPSDVDSKDEELDQTPKRYQKVELKLSRRGLDDFDFGKYNRTEFVGLENTHPNSYTNPVLQLLYFIPEVRNAMVQHLSMAEVDLSCELGFLFHMLDQAKDAPSRDRSCQSSNFLKAFRQVPEAAALGLLTSDAPLPHRIETFHRFMLNHLDNNANTGVNKAGVQQSVNQTKRGSDAQSGGDLIDSLFGYTTLQTTVCPNGHDAVRNTRSRVIELSYHLLGGREQTSTARAFSEILYSSLCRESKTRAWCDKCKAYQSMCQTRRPLNLPPLLSVQCGVASERDISCWRQDDSSTNSWVPERLRLSVEDRGDLTVEEQRADSSGSAKSFESDSGDISPTSGSYEIFAVISYIGDSGELRSRGKDGHLVLHVRPPASYYQNDPKDSWYLFNDFRVSEADIEDALAFQQPWKTPCILLYRRTDTKSILSQPLARAAVIDEAILDAPSLAKAAGYSSASTFVRLPNDALPKEGDIVAIDSEFVTTETEEAAVRSDGSRVILRESRQVLARVSCIHGGTGETFIDDYIVPSEPVVDYLTRFSGLTADDLDPSVSTHHLVSLKTAYLKLRFLLDRGCVFVGHGLKKDFRTINIYVPPQQRIDTVELFHLPEMRKISLRFLAAYVLNSFIQSDTHDSIEDARTALLLYRKHDEIVAQGSLSKYLNNLYEAGRACKWQITDALKNFVHEDT